jgi:hypothetical protein
MVHNSSPSVGRRTIIKHPAVDCPERSRLIQQVREALEAMRLAETLEELQHCVCCRA